MAQAAKQNNKGKKQQDEVSSVSLVCKSGIEAAMAARQSTKAHELEKE